MIAYLLYIPGAKAAHSSIASTSLFFPSFVCTWISTRSAQAPCLCVYIAELLVVWTPHRRCAAAIVSATVNWATFFTAITYACMNERQIHFQLLRIKALTPHRLTINHLHSTQTDCSFVITTAVRAHSLIHVCIDLFRDLFWCKTSRIHEAWHRRFVVAVARGDDTPSFWVAFYRIMYI